MVTTLKNRSNFENMIIGNSPKVQQCIDNVRKVSKSLSVTTLIFGESGTGKELFARLAHNLSPYADQPFIDINCGAIPESLLESELFGYEKGAFTGAQTQKQGMFELANGGTIFLDEIGNTTLNFQMKLLKVVEYKSFRRIGGVKEIHISTRIIAATNIDLLEAVRQGKFREDLYYRLNVFQIYIPPLRERDDDVLLIASHYIDHFNREYNRNIKGLTPAAQEMIRRYSWPGNVRQLKNALERAILVDAQDWIDVEHLRLDSERSREREVKPTKIEIVRPTPTQIDYNRLEIPDEGISLETFERDIILSAMEKAKGNLSKAARLLRISRGKLRYRLERLGIMTDEIYLIKSGYAHV